MNLLKKIFLIFICFALVLNPVLSLAEEPVTPTEEVTPGSDNPLGIVAEGAILMDLSTSQILFEKNSDKKLYPASTTKIMTGILAIELGKLNDIVTVDQEVTSLTSGSHIALDVGEKMTLDQMLHALLIESANDSALAIAKHISGNIDVFVDLMNKKAQELGAKNTNFVNPNGLHDDNHYTTAKDLALIAQYAMKNEVFRNIVKDYTYEIPPTNKKTEGRHLKSANKLLYSNQKIDVNGNSVPIKYEGAIGIKTGFTKVSQSCLVSAVKKGDRTLVAVVLKVDGGNLYTDTHKLFDYGFTQFTNENLGFKNQYVGDFTIKDGVSPFVAGILKNNVASNIISGSEKDIKSTITPINDLKAPIAKGTKVGSIDYSINGKLITKADIIASTDIDKDPNTIWYRKILNKWYILVFILLFLFRLNYVRKKNKKKKRRKKNNAPSRNKM